MSTETSGMAARLRQIEESAHAALAQRQQTVAEEVIELLPAETRVVVPAPRLGRMFIRHGEGHGEFSDVTLTSPQRVAQVAPA